MKDSGSRKFTLTRLRDKTGISGTGLVCEGIQFFNGKVTCTWHSDIASVEILESFDDFLRLHVYNHNNGSQISWEDGTDQDYE